MKYDFDHAVKRFGTYSMKWDDDAFFKVITPNLRLDGETIRLNLADMDFRCAPAIARAMHRVADFENYGYTMVTSAPEYKPAIIGWPPWGGGPAGMDHSLQRGPGWGAADHPGLFPARRWGHPLPAHLPQFHQCY